MNVRQGITAFAGCKRGASATTLMMAMHPTGNGVTTLNIAQEDDRLRLRSKYGVRMDELGKAARTADGILFASERECTRYLELKLLEKAGAIRNLRLQPRYRLFAWSLEGGSANDLHISEYRADFEYEEHLAPGAPEIALHESHNGWFLVTEDVKGVRVELYKLKKKLFEANYGREIRET